MRFGLEFALVSLTCLLSSALTSAQVTAEEGEDGSMSITTRCLTSDEFDPNQDYFEGLKFEVTDYQGPALVASGGDSFSDQVETDITTDLFSISYHNHYKIVTNYFANKTYLLYLCGTENQIPAEELEDGKHHLVLSVPHTGGVAVTETPQIPFLELLGVRTEMIAYIGDPQWVSSPCMNYMINQQDSIEVIYNAADPWNSTTNQAMTDQFLADNPDAIIFGGPFSNKDAERTVIAAATQEKTTVATFDWIGFYAAFFNLEGMSNQIAAKTKARYDCSSSNAAMLSADRPEEDQPVVLWANYFVGYNWSVVECPTWDSAYYCEYAQHCGANIISRPEGFGSEQFGYWYLDDAQILELGKDADHFIYPDTDWDTIYEQKKETLDQFKSVQNQQVFDIQGKGRTPFYEQRLAEYEVAALDFCEIVGTASNTGTGDVHTRQWFRNVFTESVGSLPECNAPDEIDEPYVARGAECSPLDGGSSSNNDEPEDTGDDSDEPEGTGDESVGDADTGSSSGVTRMFKIPLVVGLANALLAFAV